MAITNKISQQAMRPDWQDTQPSSAASSGAEVAKLSVLPGGKAEEKGKMIFEEFFLNENGK